MKTTQPKAHFIAPEILNPSNPVTVYLIGAGGTGSQVLTALARMSHSLQALGHAGLHVTLWDDDVITEANRGRQLYAECEVGLYKATALITRCNRFFGTDWKALTQQYGKGSARQTASIYVSCVDTVAARFNIAAVLEAIDANALYSNRPRYWLDFGNSKDKGQVILSTIGSITQPESMKYQPVENLPFVTVEFGQLLKQSEIGNDTPSCSLAEALEKQDLFINSSLAQMGCSLLWKMFREGMITQRGLFLNLGDYRTAPLPL